MAIPSSSIVITGFMGTGKSTVARLLAARLGRPFLDMDEELERRAGKPIPAIFVEDGEAAFRALERALIDELAERSGWVIATGGGALVDSESRRKMLDTALVVCLDATPEHIEARLKGSHARPLAGEWRERLAARQSAYAAIPIHVDTSGRTPSAVAEEIIQRCQS